MDRSMVELNQKIDDLTTQVALLTEQAQIAERQRTDRAELMRDLNPIANEAFRLSVEQLDSANRNNVTILTVAILKDLQALPDGVEVLRTGARFRGHLPGDGRDVAQPADGLREDATRDSVGTPGPAGGEDTGP